VTLAEFDHNLNFVLDDILPDVIARLRNHEKYSPCWIDFVSKEITHSLMEQL
jgi:superfamily I DNA and/or RNA helicase